MNEMRAQKGQYAWMATVGEKGQIVIPKQAREIFGIKPGDTLFLFGDEKRGIVIPPKEEFSELFGKRTAITNEKDSILLYSRSRSYQSYASRCV